jgi:hypothetical protein
VFVGLVQSSALAEGEQPGVTQTSGAGNVHAVGKFGRLQTGEDTTESTGFSPSIIEVGCPRR